MPHNSNSVEVNQNLEMEGNLHLLAARLRTKIESLCAHQKETVSSLDESPSKKIIHSTEPPSHPSHSTDLKIDQLTLQIHALERENGNRDASPPLIVDRGFKIEV